MMMSPEPMTEFEAKCWVALLGVIIVFAVVMLAVPLVLTFALA